jgi:hypothetical protein
MLIEREVSATASTCFKAAEKSSQFDLTINFVTVVGEGRVGKRVCNAHKKGGSKCAASSSSSTPNSRPVSSLVDMNDKPPFSWYFELPDQVE